MARPKQFSERILISMVEGTTASIDSLLGDGEYRLDFIRTAIEAEIDRRKQAAPAKRRRQPKSSKA